MNPFLRKSSPSELNIIEKQVISSPGELKIKSKFKSVHSVNLISENKKVQVH